jgi:hypothetical protein
MGNRRTAQAPEMTCDCQTPASMNMTEWRLDIDAWPGPNRKTWSGLRDVSQESPDGKHVAMIYSCGEIGIAKEVGRFALLAGPPESPRLLLRPRNLTCLVSQRGETVRWIGGRYCAVTPYGIRHCLSGKTKAFGGTLYLDVERRKSAYLADIYPGGAVSELPSGLTWRSWAWLSFWPVLWRLRKK